MSRLRVGRRGTALLLFGSIFAVYGCGLISSPTPIPPGLEVVAELVAYLGGPSDLPGGMWLTLALIGTAAAFLRDPIAQGLGFGALMLMPALWSLFYLVAWIAWLTPGTTWAFERGWAGSLVWGLFVGLILLIAGWPEPPTAELHAEDEA